MERTGHSSPMNALASTGPAPSAPTKTVAFTSPMDGSSKTSADSDRSSGGSQPLSPDGRRSADTRLGCLEEAVRDLPLTDDRMRTVSLERCKQPPLPPDLTSAVAPTASTVAAASAASLGSSSLGSAFKSPASGSVQTSRHIIKIKRTPLSTALATSTTTASPTTNTKTATAPVVTSGAGSPDCSPPSGSGGSQRDLVSRGLLVASASSAKSRSTPDAVRNPVMAELLDMKGRAFQRRPKDARFKPVERSVAPDLQEHELVRVSDSEWVEFTHLNAHEACKSAAMWPKRKGTEIVRLHCFGCGRDASISRALYKESKNEGGGNFSGRLVVAYWTRQLPLYSPMPIAYAHANTYTNTDTNTDTDPKEPANEPASPIASPVIAPSRPSSPSPSLSLSLPPSRSGSPMPGLVVSPDDSPAPTSAPRPLPPPSLSLAICADDDMQLYLEPSPRADTPAHSPRDSENKTKTSADEKVDIDLVMETVLDQAQQQPPAPAPTQQQPQPSAHAHSQSHSQSHSQTQPQPKCLPPGVDLKARPELATFPFRLPDCDLRLWLGRQVSDLLEGKFQVHHDVANFFSQGARLQSPYAPYNGSALAGWPGNYDKFKKQLAARLKNEPSCGMFRAITRPLPAMFDTSAVRELLHKHPHITRWYDFSAGWLDRLLLALCAADDPQIKRPLHYVGCDPNAALAEPFECMVREMKPVLPNANRGSFEFHKLRLEHAVGKLHLAPWSVGPNTLVFSSGPWFNKKGKDVEKYPVPADRESYYKAKIAVAKQALSLGAIFGHHCPAHEDDKLAEALGHKHSYKIPYKISHKKSDRKDSDSDTNADKKQFLYVYLPEAQHPSQAQVELPNGTQQHALFPLHISPSPIHGVGVFANAAIPNKQKICDWTGGVRMTHQEFKEHHTCAACGSFDWRFVYRNLRTYRHIVNKELSQRNICNYLNDGIHCAEKNGRTPRANVVLEGEALYSCAPISIGEELVLDFGADYWAHEQCANTRQQQESEHQQAHEDEKVVAFKGLVSPLKYPGGTHWTKKDIADFAEKHGIVPSKFRTFVAPFGGGGNDLIEFMRRGFREIVWADKWPPLINFFKQLQSKPSSEAVVVRIEHYLGVMSVDEMLQQFDYADDTKRPKDPIDNAATFWLFNAVCYEGLPCARASGRAYEGEPQRRVVRLRKFATFLQSGLCKITFLEQDYEVTFAATRNGDYGPRHTVAIYCNPPYPDRRLEFYGTRAALSKAWDFDAFARAYKALPLARFLVLNICDATTTAFPKRDFVYEKFDGHKHESKTKEACIVAKRGLAVVHNDFDPLSGSDNDSDSDAEMEAQAEAEAAMETDTETRTDTKTEAKTPTRVPPEHEGKACQKCRNTQKQRMRKHRLDCAQCKRTRWICDNCLDEAEKKGHCRFKGCTPPLPQAAPHASTSTERPSAAPKPAPANTDCTATDCKARATARFYCREQCCLCDTHFDEAFTVGECPACAKTVEFGCDYLRYDKGKYTVRWHVNGKEETIEKHQTNFRSRKQFWLDVAPCPSMAFELEMANTDAKLDEVVGRITSAVAVPDGEFLQQSQPQQVGERKQRLQQQQQSAARSQSRSQRGRNGKDEKVGPVVLGLGPRRPGEIRIADVCSGPNSSLRKALKLLPPAILDRITLITIDYKSEYKPDWCVDLTSWDFSKVPGADDFDYVWFSPPCTDYTLANTKKSPSKQLVADGVVQAGHRFIDYQKRLRLDVTENPGRGDLGRRGFMVKRYPPSSPSSPSPQRLVTHYCMYSDEAAPPKETMLFTRLGAGWLTVKTCSTASGSEERGCEWRKRADNGRWNHTVRLDQLSQGRRCAVPPKLHADIILQLVTSMGPYAAVSISKTGTNKDPNKQKKQSGKPSQPTTEPAKRTSQEATGGGSSKRGKKRKRSQKNENATKSASTKRRKHTRNIRFRLGVRKSVDGRELELIAVNHRFGHITLEYLPLGKELPGFGDEQVEDFDPLSEERKYEAKACTWQDTEPDPDTGLPHVLAVAGEHVGWEEDTCWIRWLRGELEFDGEGNIVKGECPEYEKTM